MSYELQAFIAAEHVFSNLMASDTGYRIYKLAHGYCLLPISEAVYDIIHTGDPSGSDDNDSENPYMTWQLERLGKLVSHGGAVAYVDVLYDGGRGYQFAVVWENGELLLDMALDERPAPPGADGAVNRALAAIGVVAGKGQDEFDALGLGRCRDTEDWCD